MAAYAATIDAPQLRDAIALNAWEENRHKQVLSRMVATYGIARASEPPYAWPKDPEWAYLVTGYSGCIDSFFAFGLFELARRSGLFPPALIDTFEPVMQEEAGISCCSRTGSAGIARGCHRSGAFASS